MKIILHMTDQTKKEFNWEDIFSVVFVYPNNGEFKIIPDEERASFRVMSAYNVCVSPMASNHIKIKEDTV